MEKSKVPLRLSNPTSSHQTAHKGTTLASCEPFIRSVRCRRWDNDTRVVLEVWWTHHNGQHYRSVLDFLKDLLNWSSFQYKAGQKGEVATPLIEFVDVFSTSDDDLKTCIVKHQIDTGGAKPIRQPARRIPINHKKEAEAQVQKMLERDVIEQPSSPWASPIVLVKKKDRFTRFCVDYRRLNDVTAKDSYPLPRLDDSLAFTAGSGLYQFKIMPFGLANAPATFAHLTKSLKLDSKVTETDKTTVFTILSGSKSKFQRNNKDL